MATTTAPAHAHAHGHDDTPHTTGGKYYVPHESPWPIYGSVTLFYLAMSWLLMRLFALIQARYLSYPVR